MAQSSKKVSKAITAQATYSDTLRVSGKRIINLSITATAMSATIHLQRKRPEDSTWGDVTSFTAVTEKIIESVGNWDWRVGCKTGNFSSATSLVATLST